MNQAKEIVKQMIDLNKDSFLSMCKTISFFQDQTETMTNSLLDQATWLPNGGRDMISEWSKAGKQGLERFKKNVEMGYSKLEDLMS